MKYEDLAFVNQQLSSLLRQGVSLEGGLQRVCAEMKAGMLRDELGALEQDLSKGISLDEALQSRKFPPFYCQMLRIGVRSGDLVGILVLLTDYYQRANSLWTRFKGLMVYPVFVLAAAMIVSGVVAYSALTIGRVGLEDWNGAPFPSNWIVGGFIPPVVFGLLFCGCLCVLAVPALQRKLRWRLSPFKEAALSQAGSTLGLMMTKGCPLKEALAMLQQLEKGSIAENEIIKWQIRLSEGHGKLCQFAQPGVAFTPLFLWLASNAGEDLGAGFQRAGEVYYERAMRRAEMLLYSVLPVLTLLLGAMIVAQLLPVVLLLQRALAVMGGP